MYRRVFVVSLIAAALPLPGYEPKAKEELHYSYPAQSGGTLTVASLNGPVEITAWDQNTIDITATKYAETQDLLPQIKIDIAVSAGSVQVKTIPPDGAKNVGVKYVIKVPRRTELAEIRSSNGPIRVTEVEGAANLQTSNGPVHVSKTHGKLDIKTSNGPVNLDQIEGETNVHTSNGPVHADLAGTNGGPVTLMTSNGPVDLKLAQANQSAIKASTSNGPITLHMPAAAGASLKAQTSSRNQIKSDFEVRKEGDNSPSHLQGVVGIGGPTVDLTTSNGPIRLLKL
jgi:DUF4097 and DUF4098 domain-containing protein YvlB